MSDRPNRARRDTRVSEWRGHLTTETTGRVDGDAMKAAKVAFGATLGTLLATALYKVSAALLAALFALLMHSAQPALQPVPDGQFRLAIDRHGAFALALAYLRRLAAWLRGAANKLKLGLALGNGSIAYA